MEYVSHRLQGGREERGERREEGGREIEGGKERGREN